jgi:hypothetical protein
MKRSRPEFKVKAYLDTYVQNGTMSVPQTPIPRTTFPQNVRNNFPQTPFLQTTLGPLG